MDEGVRTKRRKRYFCKDQPFVIPKSTSYRRQQERRAQLGAPSSSALAADDGETAPSIVDVPDPPSDGQFSPEHSAQTIADPVTAHDEAAVESSGSDDEDIFVPFSGPLGEPPEESNPMPESLEDDDECELLASDFAELEAATLPGSTTTKAAAVIMIMAFVVTHGLTWVALNDLLRLIDGLFRFQGDVLPRSKHVFRKMWSSRMKTLIKQFFYCDTCGSVLEAMAGLSSLRCPDCMMDTELALLKTKGNFFIILDLKEQVRCLLAKAKTALYQSLTSLKNAVEGDGRALLGDITSGQMWQELRKSRKLNWMDLTITLNTDGSPVFKSSTSSVWPIQFTVNEQPLRHRLKNCMIGGLWFGQHPHMRTFMTKFVEEVNQFGQILWKEGSAVLSSRLYALCCCVDAPARASVMNMVQFNGLFGCPWCYNCAEHHEGAQRYMETAIGDERTPEEMSGDMKFAERIGDTVNGIEGQSPFNHLKHFNIVFRNTVEYMHCVLISVTKCISDHWFDSSNCRQPFYIGCPAAMAKVDSRLLAIKPPHSFTRLPRSVKDKCHWKASEWRHWLLFYAIPCCLGIFPQRYLNHYALLVEAIFTLLLEELTSEQINNAGRLLQDFVARVPALYGPRLMTFNMHQLLHLAKAARNFGPLWAHSAFVFESGNGRVLSVVTSAKGAPNQVIERMVMLQQVEVALAVCSIQDKPKNFASTLLGHPLTANVTRVDGSVMFGSCDPFPILSAEEANGLSSHFGFIPSVVEYFRFSFCGSMLHSTSYTRVRKSNSAAVCSIDNDFFIINRILQVELSGSCASSQCILLCTKIICMEDQQRLPPHIMEGFLSLSGAVVVLKLSDLLAPCLLVEFKHEDKLYICKLPNVVERD